MRSADVLREVFNRVGIIHEVKARNVHSLDGQEPRKPLPQELEYALIEVDVTQKDLKGKVREGLMLVAAWRHASRMKAEFPNLSDLDRERFLAELPKAFER